MLLEDHSIKNMREAITHMDGYGVIEALNGSSLLTKKLEITWFLITQNPIF